VNPISFAKMQATGNDFVLISDDGTDHDWAELARAMCHRHFGVGADGLLLVSPSQKADCSMRMFNPDGSEAEACGNGIRCVAKYVMDWSDHSAMS
jgi:diaminopimelate epimerase